MKKSNSIVRGCIFCLVVLFATGCGAPKSDSEADTAGSSSTAESSNKKAASSGDSEALFRACLDTTNMGESLCKCVSNKADSDLSEDGVAFLVAMITEDEANTDRLRSKLSMQEVVKAGMFMTKAPAACAAEGYEAETD